MRWALLTAICRRVYYDDQTTKAPPVNAKIKGEETPKRMAAAGEGDCATISVSDRG